MMNVGEEHWPAQTKVRKVIASGRKYYLLIASLQQYQVAFHRITA
jgi:hypothetical protein